MRNVGLAILVAVAVVLAACSGGGLLGGQARQPAAGGGLLSLIDPADEVSEVAGGARSAVVTGRTQPAAVVSVNGLLVAVDGSGAFRAEVPLEDELTVIEVVASDAAGAEVRVLRVVSRD